ncbi:MAG: spore germination protein [Christensenellales bacterium]
MLARIRKRLTACSSDFALSAGEVEQLIEDHPMALIPQCVSTERPDRAASFLAEGQVVVLTDGSPLALGAPSTFWHQLHTSDDASMRWQYGTFLRVVRLIGMLIHLFLPGAYIAVIRFHTELISPILLASVYETSSRVPTPIFLEALLMTLAFDLISEAGLRAPGAMGNALGIVSGLILGQSAVSADIVSPLLLIVVAASGLGGFCIPNYALSVGIKIIQLLFLTAGALGGLYLMALLGLALLCAACAMRSVGSPLTAPLTPKRPGNPDLPIRFRCGGRKRGLFLQDRSIERCTRAAYRARACGGRRMRRADFRRRDGLTVPLASTPRTGPLCPRCRWAERLALPRPKGSPKRREGPSALCWPFRCSFAALCCWPPARRSPSRRFYQTAVC